MKIHLALLETHKTISGQKGGGHPSVYSMEDMSFLVPVSTTMRRSKKNPYPHIWGYLMRTPSLFIYVR